MPQWLRDNFLYVLLALAAVFTFDWLYQCRKRLRIRWYSALILAILHVVIGVLSVRFFALAEAGFDAQKAGNMSLFGSIFFLPLAYFLGAKLFRRPVADVFDVFTIPLAATLFAARINCLIAGCCLGAVIPGTELRFPTREAELIFYAVFIIVMFPRVFKSRGRGEAFPIFMIAYGAFRAVDECFRESSSSGIFHISHIWALITLALGTVILILLRKRSHSSSSSRPAVK